MPKKTAADKHVFAKLPLVTLFISNLMRLTAVVCMKVRFEAKVIRGFSLSPRRFRDSLLSLRRLLLISFTKKNQEKPLGPGYFLTCLYLKNTITGGNGSCLIKIKSVIKL